MENSPACYSTSRTRSDKERDRWNLRTCHVTAAQRKLFLVNICWWILTRRVFLPANIVNTRRGDSRRAQRAHHEHQSLPASAPLLYFNMETFAKTTEWARVIISFSCGAFTSRHTMRVITSLLAYFELWGIKIDWICERKTSRLFFIKKILHVFRFLAFFCSNQGQWQFCEISFQVFLLGVMLSKRNLLCLLNSFNYLYQSSQGSSVFSA